MRFLITLEPTETGFAVQAPDLAIITFGKDIEEAKLAAVKAIKINLNAYLDAGKPIPQRRSTSDLMRHPDFANLLFTFVDVEISPFEVKEAA